MPGWESGPMTEREQLTRADGTPIRVLTVDDEPAITELLSMALRYEGWDVTTAHSGTTAVQAARDTRPDVLVLDPSLPCGGGDGVLAVMRDDTDLPPIAVIVLANGHDRSSLYRLAQFHVHSYHVKPLDVRQLAERIRALAGPPRVDAHTARMA